MVISMQYIFVIPCHEDISESRFYSKGAKIML